MLQLSSLFLLCMGVSRIAAETDYYKNSITSRQTWLCEMSYTVNTSSAISDNVMVTNKDKQCSGPGITSPFTVQNHNECLRACWEKTGCTGAMVSSSLKCTLWIKEITKMASQAGTYCYVVTPRGDQWDYQPDSPGALAARGEPADIVKAVAQDVSSDLNVISQMNGHQAFIDEPNLQCMGFSTEDQKSVVAFQWLKIGTWKATERVEYGKLVYGDACKQSDFAECPYCFPPRGEKEARDGILVHVPSNNEDGEGCPVEEMLENCHEMGCKAVVLTSSEANPGFLIDRNREEVSMKRKLCKSLACQRLFLLIGPPELLSFSTPEYYGKRFTADISALQSEWEQLYANIAFLLVGRVLPGASLLGAGGIAANRLYTWRADAIDCEYKLPRTLMWSLIVLALTGLARGIIAFACPGGYTCVNTISMQNFVFVFPGMMGVVSSAFAVVYMADMANVPADQIKKIKMGAGAAVLFHEVFDILFSVTPQIGLGNQVAWLGLLPFLAQFVFYGMLGYIFTFIKKIQAEKHKELGADIPDKVVEYEQRLVKMIRLQLRGAFASLLSWVGRFGVLVPGDAANPIAFLIFLVVMYLGLAYEASIQALSMSVHVHHVKYPTKDEAKGKKAKRGSTGSTGSSGKRNSTRRSRMGK